MKNASTSTCHICGSNQLTLIDNYSQLHRVTSDCKPWPTGGRLAVCGSCSCAQAVLDEKWHTDAASIYSNYTIYHQAGGAEQSVFDVKTGMAQTRSNRLVQNLCNSVNLPADGRLLDIGCGNGALLKAFSTQCPKWSLAGAEVNDHYKIAVEQIPGVERLFTQPVTQIPGQFDIVTMIHALEHIPSPREFLIQVRDKIKEGGFLLVQVPDCSTNPFMFLVADHATHFFVPALRELTASTGFEVLVATNTLIPKEITVIARKQGLHPRPTTACGNFISEITSALDWLTKLSAGAQKIASEGQLGIFGASIAATWLQAELDGKAEFFVDEDPSRPGQELMGRKILSPTQIPTGSRVLVALPTSIALSIKTRLSSAYPNIRLYTPTDIGC